MGTHLQCNWVISDLPINVYKINHIICYDIPINRIQYCHHLKQSSTCMNTDHYGNDFKVVVICTRTTKPARPDEYAYASDAT